MPGTPRLSQNGQSYYVGIFPEADGSNYDPSIPSVTWNDLRNLVIAAGPATYYVVAAGGKIHYRTEDECDGISAVFTPLTIRETIRNPRNVWDGNTFEEQVQDMFGLWSTPEHITGWSVRAV